MWDLNTDIKLVCPEVDNASAYKSKVNFDI